jgi:hypothetical protein
MLSHLPYIRCYTNHHTAMGPDPSFSGVEGLLEFSAPTLAEKKSYFTGTRITRKKKKPLLSSPDPTASSYVVSRVGQGVFEPQHFVCSIGQRIELSTSVRYSYYFLVPGHHDTHLTYGRPLQHHG